jgi:isoquinoline 1-oxidoreductase alpha subunit
MINLRINGQVHSVEATDDTPLLWVLRDLLGLTGTKFGCGIAQCGACTVHVDGNAVRSCLLPIGSIQDRAITTIEAIGATPEGARKYSRPGSILKSSNAAIASPGRSWPPPLC